MNKSWNMVPSILQTVSKTFSTEDEKQAVIDFRNKLKAGNKLANLDSTFTSMLSVIDKNINWRGTNEDVIVNWISDNYNSAAKFQITLGLMLAMFIIVLPE